jgi:hypothetical protein
MLIKIGPTTAINVTRILRVEMLEEVTKTSKDNGFWKPKTLTEETTFAVKVFYRDIDGKDTSFKLYGIKDLDRATKIQEEVLGQIKELELENMSATLENAIRNS